MLSVLCPHRVVEFKMEESMKKAAEVLNKHSLGGRPLKVKEVRRGSVLAGEGEFWWKVWGWLRGQWTQSSIK